MKSKRMSIKMNKEHLLMILSVDLIRVKKYA